MTPAVPPRVIAIDWSGDAKHADRKIWLAEADGGNILRLESGRSREQITQHLLDEAARGDRLIVGFDFAFSFPAWFLCELGIASAPDLWRRLHADEFGEWLRECPPPFWGRKGKRCTLPRAKRFRCTDNDAGAKSVFQVGGAGAVGTGSIRGMPVLHRLREGGFRIWPFDDPDPTAPLALEIYPRAWSRRVVKSDAAARRAFFDRPEFASVSIAMRTLAASTDDAFDAAVAALAMDRGRSELEALPRSGDETTRLEGHIWGSGDAR